MARMAQEKQVEREQVRRPYEAPRVIFHSRDELLRSVGPAVGCARWSVLGQRYDPRDEQPTKLA